MRLDFCEIPDSINNPNLYKAQLPSIHKITTTMLYGFPAYWDVFSDWTFKTKRARRNHTNHILLFTCNIAREEALLLMLDSSQAKKSHCRACSRATCNTSHKLLVPKLACQQTFFLARKRRKEPISKNVCEGGQRGQ